VSGRASRWVSNGAIFYEDGGLRIEDGGSRTGAIFYEDGGLRIEDGGSRTENRGYKTED